MLYCYICRTAASFTSAFKLNLIIHKSSFKKNTIIACGGSDERNLWYGIFRVSLNDSMNTDQVFSSCMSAETKTYICLKSQLYYIDVLKILLLKIEYAEKPVSESVHN